MQVLDQTAKVEKLLIKTQNETHKMEEAVMQSLAEQTTLQKAAQSTDKVTQGMQQQMHAKENEIAQVRNELSRIKVDALNTHRAQHTGREKFRAGAWHIATGPLMYPPPHLLIIIIIHLS